MYYANECYLHETCICHVCLKLLMHALMPSGLFWNICRLLTLCFNQKTVKIQNRKWKMFQFIFVFPKWMPKIYKPFAYCGYSFSSYYSLCGHLHVSLYKYIFFMVYYYSWWFVCGLIITRHEKIRIFCQLHFSWNPNEWKSKEIHIDSV